MRQSLRAYLVVNEHPNKPDPCAGDVVSHAKVVCVCWMYLVGIEVCIYGRKGVKYTYGRALGTVLLEYYG